MKVEACLLLNAQGLEQYIEQALSKYWLNECIHCSRNFLSCRLRLTVYWIETYAKMTLLK